MKIDQKVNFAPKRFKLNRIEDVSGVSGTGVVAYGVMFSDRTAALRWCSALSSLAVYTDIDDVVSIHGHNGATVLEFID